MTASEVFVEQQSGPIRDSAIVESFVANGAIELFAPVVLVAPGTGETLPRVNTTTTGGDAAVEGVAVGPKLASGKTADAAGDKVNVVVHGFAKLKVLTATVNRNDALETSTTAGQARVQASLTIRVDTLANQGADTVVLGNNIRKAFALALTAATVASSIVAVHVNTRAGVGAVV